MRTIKVNEPDSKLRRAIFDVRQSDGVTPALGEDGQQPQISISTAPFTNTGIGILHTIGFGRYYAELDQSSIRNIGDYIETRYKGISTIDTPGDSFQVVDTGEIFSLVVPSVAIGTYIDVATAEPYFANKLRADAWNDALPDDKLKSLIEATALIDQLNLFGVKTNILQLLQFPRNGNTDIPDDIKIACCEIAIKLLEGIDPEIEARNLAVESQTYANVKTSYNRTYIPDYIRSGIPSIKAWNLLLPYLADTRTITLKRAN